MDKENVEKIAKQLYGNEEITVPELQHRACIKWREAVTAIDRLLDSGILICKNKEVGLYTIQSNVSDEEILQSLSNDDEEETDCDDEDDSEEHEPYGDKCLEMIEKITREVETRQEAIAKVKEMIYNLSISNESHEDAAEQLKLLEKVLDAFETASDEEWGKLKKICKPVEGRH